MSAASRITELRSDKYSFSFMNYTIASAITNSNSDLAFCDCYRTIRRIIATIASRHDYTAWQTAKAENCQPVSDPVITNAGQPVETFAFHCGDGRELTMNCESGVGCR